MLIVTYIGHSGFLVEMEQAYFLFDYVEGKIPYMNPCKDLFIFVSHSHKDHYDEVIFEIGKRMEKAYYILSADVSINYRIEVDKNTLYRLDADQTINLGHCLITTLKSTDLGVAFLVSLGSKTIYHAGDLNWWHWNGETDSFNKEMEENYKKEIDKLQDEPIDIAFVPVDLRLEDKYYLGLKYFMEKTKTNYVFPMHFWGNYQVFERLVWDQACANFRDRIVRIKEEGQVFEIE